MLEERSEDLCSNRIGKLILKIYKSCSSFLSVLRTDPQTTDQMIFQQHLQDLRVIHWLTFFSTSKLLILSISRELILCRFPSRYSSVEIVGHFILRTRRMIESRLIKFRVEYPRLARLWFLGCIDHPWNHPFHLPYCHITNLILGWNSDPMSQHELRLVSSHVMSCHIISSETTWHVVSLD
jgi:hypothetical protein